MEELLFHPKIVHLPIALAVLIPALTLGVTLAWWRGWMQKRVWVIVIAAQLALVVSGFVAMQTGEADEERVEEVVAESAIETHEEAAETFVWSAVGVLALMAFAGLFAGPMRKEPAGLLLAALATLGTVAVLALGHQVGDAGGRLVYVHGAANVHLPKGDTAPAPTKDDRHDDDDDD